MMCDFIAWMLFLGSLVDPLSICSVIYALILRITHIFHKKIGTMMPIIITMTSIIFSELCSNNEVPYSVTSVLLLVFYLNRFFLVDTVFREYSIIFGSVFKAKLSA